LTDDIRTYTGKVFRPLAPDPALIDIRDIAHALSMEARWNGHTREFMSVAEHSVRVSLICAAKDALWGLLHDASEAYIRDIPSPIKNAESFTFYRLAEARLQAAIAVAFNLPAVVPASVHRADKVMLHTEARDLFAPHIHADWIDKTFTQPGKLRPYTIPQASEIWFLERFRQLTKAVAA
jgi:hypothetical protein